MKVQTTDRKQCNTADKFKEVRENTISKISKIKRVVAKKNF